MKTLLVSDVPPTHRFSGALLTWHLCKNFNASTLVGYYPVSKILGDVTAEYPFQGSVVSKVVIKRNDGAYRPRWLPKRARFFFSLVSELYRKHIEVPRLCKGAIAFAKEQGVDRIWIILQGQTLIWMSEYLIKHSDLPVHSQVWDSPNWWIKACLIDRFSAKIIQKSYRYSLKSASEFASPSFYMAERYQKLHGKKSETLIGITPSNYIVLDQKEKSKEKVVIGIAGQIYAIDAFTSLIEALDSTYWEIEGRRIEIHYWGYSGLPLTLNRTRVILKGYVRQEQLTQELSKCDILYCPYWFASDFREECSTSFPSKVTSYLSTSSVLFFHGPEYSSPVKVLQEGPSAVLCFSTNAESIKMKLREALFHPQREQLLKNAKKVLAGPLGEDFLHQSFRRFMRLESADL